MEKVVENDTDYLHIKPNDAVDRSKRRRMMRRHWSNNNSNSEGVS